MSGCVVAFSLSALYSVKLVYPSLWVRYWSWFSRVKALWPSDSVLFLSFGLLYYPRGLTDIATFVKLRLLVALVS